MKFAIVNGSNAEAVKGVKGICPCCSSELIAKCGERKMHHWAHKGIRNCDPWWENETEWHRSWKGNFDTNWQEKILHDEITGEKHIADVQTTHGLVVEFQHSHIHPIERNKRQDFYKNMVWVIDGTRLKRDYPRFIKGLQSFRSTNKQGLFTVDLPDECFPSAWVDGLVHVVFDFKGLETITDPKDWRNFLFYLAPKTSGRESFVFILTRESFIDNINSGRWFTKQEEPKNNVEISQISNYRPIPQRQTQYIVRQRRFGRRRRF
jgi:competence protein CoiA